MRVLIVEDDSATAQSIELMLKCEGVIPYSTDLGEEAQDLAKIYDYDLILLDLNLPDVNGMDVLRHLRAAKVHTPIMILTGDSSVETKVKAFTAGADDYLTKPFHKDELVARIGAIVRRNKGHSTPVVTVGPLKVDNMAKVVTINGKQVNLTGKEYGIIELLALRKNSTITKEVLLNHLYGGLDEPEMKIVDVFICKIRKKLRLAGAEDLIVTIWGRGYCLRDPPLDVRAANDSDASVSQAASA